MSSGSAGTADKPSCLDGNAYVARAEFLRLVPGAMLHVDNCLYSADRGPGGVGRGRSAVTSPSGCLGRSPTSKIEENGLQRRDLGNTVRVLSLRSFDMNQSSRKVRRDALHASSEAVEEPPVFADPAQSAVWGSG